MRHRRPVALGSHPARLMSYQINLKGSGFNRGAWLADVRERVLGAGNGLAPLCRELNGFSQMSDESELWLLPVGGIRGVFANRDSDGCSLTLPAASSREDFAMAAKLVKLALNNGAEAIDENHVPLDGGDEEFSEVHQRQMEFFHFVLNHEESKDKGHFPLGPLKVPLKESDAHGSWTDLERKLVERVGRFASCGFAPIKKLGEEPDSLIISLYQQAACLINSRTKMVVVGCGDPPGESNPVEAETFYSFFGDELERLGNWIYVPAVGADRFEVLLAGSGRRTPPPLPGGSSACTPPPLPGSQSRGVSEQDWHTLVKAPLQIFLMISSADGEPSDKSFSAFAKFIDAKITEDSPIIAKIAQETRDHHELFLRELLDPDCDPLNEWRSLSTLLDSTTLPLDETRAVRRFLIEVANQIARPTGGLFGFGGGVSKAKKERLDLVIGTLTES